MKRKVSINIEPFQRRLGDKGALEFAARIGADAVDFDLYTARWDYRNEASVYARSDGEIRAYFEDIAAHAAKIGIEIGQTHGRISTYGPDEEENAHVLENARRDLLATAALGCRVCVMHGVTTGAMGPDAPRKVMHDLNFRCFTDILPYAKEYGVILATETFGDSPSHGCCDFFGNIDEFLITYNKIAAKMGTEHFRTCMDTGHCNKATRFNGNPSPADCIRLLGSSIVCLHLNDNDTLTDQHKIPMTGTIDWNDVFDALDEVGYTGNYNMEIAWGHFGRDFAEEEAAFAVSVLRHYLNTRYGKEGD